MSKAHKVIAILAHPDDESLGPSGTLAKFALDREVYLICVTSGEAAGRTNEEKLLIGQIRRKEVLKSAKILGIKKVFFLGYEDGTLCNNFYHKLARDLKEKIEIIKPELLLTYELRGVSGHIDHIAVSFITTFVFRQYSFIKKLMYYVTSSDESSKMGDYFIYFPEGYSKEEVDEVVNVEKVWDKKVRAMHCHQSQLHDVKRVLKNKKDKPQEEYFLVRTK